MNENEIFLLLSNPHTGVHTHTPDLEEGSSLLQVTQQMGRRIPAQGNPYKEKT